MLPLWRRHPRRKKELKKVFMPPFVRGAIRHSEPFNKLSKGKRRRMERRFKHDQREKE